LVIKKKSVTTHGNMNTSIKVPINLEVRRVPEPVWPVFQLAALRLYKLLHSGSSYPHYPLQKWRKWR